MAIGALLVACKKEDMPPKRAEESFGTISFSSTMEAPYSPSVIRPSSDIKLNVTSVQTAPFGPNMQTRIYAWNGLVAENYRAMVIVVMGDYDDYSAGNTYGLNIRYYKGLTNSGSYSSIPSMDFFTETLPPAISVPIQFDQVEVKTTAENRKMIGSIDQFVYSGDTLSNFKIDINRFGGGMVNINFLMSFDLNGLPSGSFESQLSTCKNPEAGTPGIHQLKAEFAPDSRNPLQSLTFDFVHHSNKLAYNGPVGKYDLVDGLGYTEIKVTAVDQFGKIFTEQKGNGFVVVRSEGPWNEYFNGVEVVLTEGSIWLQFEMELISTDGSILTITNGNAYYKIKM